MCLDFYLFSTDLFLLSILIEIKSNQLGSNYMNKSCIYTQSAVPFTIVLNRVMNFSIGLLIMTS